MIGGLRVSCHAMLFGILNLYFQAMVGKIFKANLEYICTSFLAYSDSLFHKNILNISNSGQESTVSN